LSELKLGNNRLVLKLGNNRLVLKDNRSLLMYTELAAGMELCADLCVLCGALVETGGILEDITLGTGVCELGDTLVVGDSSLVCTVTLLVESRSVALTDGGETTLEELARDEGDGRRGVVVRDNRLELAAIKLDIVLTRLPVSNVVWGDDDV
jgi:hypothetical protein